MENGIKFESFSELEPGIDEEITQKTKEFTSLPVTPEQGGLLDEILQLMAERTKDEEKLQSIVS